MDIAEVQAPLRAVSRGNYMQTVWFEGWTAWRVLGKDHNSHERETSKMNTHVKIERGGYLPMWTHKQAPFLILQLWTNFVYASKI